MKNKILFIFLIITIVSTNSTMNVNAAYSNDDFQYVITNMQIGEVSEKLLNSNNEEYIEKTPFMTLEGYGLIKDMENKSPAYKIEFLVNNDGTWEPTGLEMNATATSDPALYNKHLGSDDPNITIPGCDPGSTETRCTKAASRRLNNDYTCELFLQHKGYTNTIYIERSDVDAFNTDPNHTIKNGNGEIQTVIPGYNNIYLRKDNCYSFFGTNHEDSYLEQFVAGKNVPGYSANNQKTSEVYNNTFFRFYIPLDAVSLPFPTSVESVSEYKIRLTINPGGTLGSGFERSREINIFEDQFGTQGSEMKKMFSFSNVTNSFKLTASPLLARSKDVVYKGFVKTEAATCNDLWPRTQQYGGVYELHPVCRALGSSFPTPLYYASATNNSKNGDGKTYSVIGGGIINTGSGYIEDNAGLVEVKYLTNYYTTDELNGSSGPYTSSVYVLRLNAQGINPTYGTLYEKTNITGKFIAQAFVSLATGIVEDTNPFIMTRQFDCSLSAESMTSEQRAYCCAGDADPSSPQTIAKLDFSVVPFSEIGEDTTFAEQYGDRNNDGVIEESNNEYCPLTCSGNTKFRNLNLKACCTQSDATYDLDAADKANYCVCSNKEYIKLAADDPAITDCPVSLIYCPVITTEVLNSTSAPKIENIPTSLTREEKGYYKNGNKISYQFEMYETDYLNDQLVANPLCKVNCKEQITLTYPYLYITEKTVPINYVLAGTGFEVNVEADAYQICDAEYEGREDWVKEYDELKEAEEELERVKAEIVSYKNSFGSQFTSSCYSTTCPVTPRSEHEYYGCKIYTRTCPPGYGAGGFWGFYAYNYTPIPDTNDCSYMLVSQINGGDLVTVPAPGEDPIIIPKEYSYPCLQHNDGPVCKNGFTYNPPSKIFNVNLIHTNPYARKRIVVDLGTVSDNNGEVPSTRNATCAVGLQKATANLQAEITALNVDLLAIRIRLTELITQRDDCDDYESKYSDPLKFTLKANTSIDESDYGVTGVDLEVLDRSTPTEKFFEPPVTEIGSISYVGTEYVSWTKEFEIDTTFGLPKAYLDPNTTEPTTSGGIFAGNKLYTSNDSFTGYYDVLFPTITVTGEYDAHQVTIDNCRYHLINNVFPAEDTFAGGLGFYTRPVDLKNLFPDTYDIPMNWQAFSSYISAIENGEVGNTLYKPENVIERHFMSVNEINGLRECNKYNFGYIYDSCESDIPR